MAELAKRPDGVSGDSVLQRRLTLSEMLDLPSFTEVCRGFTELYRIGVKVYEEQGPKLVDIKGQATDYCAYLYESPNARALCGRTATRAKDGPIEGPEAGKPIADGPKGLLSVPCFAGCRYLVMPIRLEGDVLGRVVFGPFVSDDLKDVPASVLTSGGPSIDLGKARELMQKMRRAPESTVARVMAHFAAIVDSLVFAGQKVRLTSEVHIEATRESFREIEAKNRDLEATNARLRELDRLKSNFLATVSHELRTPLTSIIGYSEMLSQGMAGQLNQEQNEYVHTILEKGESLLSLISQILDITQIEAGRVRLSFMPCDVNDLVKQAVTSVTPQAQKKGIALETRLVPGMSRPSVDKDKLRQCLVNLLANSLKFTNEGGRIRATVLADAPPGLLEIPRPSFALMVEDSGIGIPPDQLERIFESFYQVDQSSTRQFGGAGLGLAIVKSFVEAHEGKVRVESEVGRYSRFILAMPYAPRAQQVETDPPF